MSSFDINAIHPSLRKYYAGNVAREIHTEGGATVRVWDTCLTQGDERRQLVAEAWRIADGIERRAAVQAAG